MAPGPAAKAARTTGSTPVATWVPAAAAPTTAANAAAAAAGIRASDTSVGSAAVATRNKLTAVTTGSVQAPAAPAAAGPAPDDRAGRIIEIKSAEKTTGTMVEEAVSAG